MADIRIKRGTRAQVEAAKASGTLAAGEPYLITDESRLAVGTASDAYATAAIEGHTHSGVYEPAMTAASQAEMEAGTEAGLRSMSPLRVAQAISALAPSPSGGGSAAKSYFMAGW